MANSFFNFLTRFVSGTTVKAGPVNDRFTEVQSGFDNVETASKSSLKVTGYSSSIGITATPDSFLMLNASGTPYASATLSFAPNFGGFKAQNLGDGVAASDAITYGQAQTLINTAAYGSPTVVSLPSLTGNALKTLRVNAGGVATEWADSLPPTTNTGEYLYALDGAPTWTYGGGNLFAFSSGEYSSGFDLAVGVWYSGQAGSIEISNAESAVLAGDLAVNTDGNSPIASASKTYTASCLFACNSLAAGKVSLFLRFLNSSKVLISESSVGISTLTDLVRRRYALTATSPALTAYLQIGIKATSALALDAFYVSKFKVEAGSVATPWSDEATEYKLATYISYVTHYYDSTTGTTRAQVGTNASGDASLELMGPSGGTTSANVKFVSRNEAVAEGTGALDVYCGRAAFSNVIGYSAMVANGALGATPTIDFMDGAKQSGSLSANAVITLTAPPSDIVFEAKLYLKQDATGSRTATFASAATIKHVGGSAKAPQTAANSETCYNVTWDGARFIISGYDL